MHRIALFVYGSLLSPRILRAVIGRAPRPQRATLQGYRRVSLRGQAYPGLLPDGATATTGAVLRVDARELRVLDRYEGELYRRERIVVRLDDGTTRSAQTYVLAPGARRRRTERPWSPEIFLRRRGLRMP
jgi:gamma-glutamylcyclotransferase (GGCT)/AIG2-like uncharacterized protein YtfP